MLRRTLLALLTLTLMACGKTHEGTVTYNIHLQEGDISGTSIAETDHIKPDNSQWNAFLNAAKGTLEESPKEFEINKVRLQLDVANSKNVGNLEDVLSGEGALFLRTETGAQVDIATFEDLKGTAQVEVDLTGNDLKELHAAMASSNFRLGLRSPTPKASTADFDARILVTLDVAAY